MARLKHDKTLIDSFAAQSKDATRSLRRKQAKKRAQPTQAPPPPSGKTVQNGRQPQQANPDLQVNPQPPTVYSGMPQYLAIDDRTEIEPPHGRVAFGVMSLGGCSLSAANAALGSKRRQAKVGVLLQELMAELEGDTE